MKAARLALAALVVALAAGGCTASGTSVAHEARAWRPDREIPAIGRLRRWDGAAFVPVGASAVRGGDVSVLVPESGEGVSGGFAALARAIVAADPRASVLEFGGSDGQALAVALGQVIDPAFATVGERLQMIGYRRGAAVASVASLALARPPEQLTLLDAPGGVLGGYLALLPVGRGPGRTFVDSYSARRGTAYASEPGLESVVDVRLRYEQHEYPVRWYTASADDLSAGVGFAWSPLVGDPPDCLACSYRQDARLALARVSERRTHPTALRSLEVVPLGGAPAGRRPEGVELRAPGRRLWQVELERSPDDLAIEFDYRFLRGPSGARLSVWLDDRSAFGALADWSGVAGHHAVLDVTSRLAGKHTLTAVLRSSGRGRAPAVVVLGGFRVRARPETASSGRGLPAGALLTLLGLALWLGLGLLGWLLRHRSGAHISER